MMVTILIAIALCFYIGASATLAASFAGGHAARPRISAALIGGGMAVHAAALAAYTLRHGELPLVGLTASLCTLTFLITIFLFVTTVVSESRPVGLVLMPLICVLLLIALILGIEPSGQPLAFRGVWFSFHVLLAFAGYAALTVAFAAGLLYLLQFRELKGKRLGRVFVFLPSLPSLDTLGRRALAIGFPALSVALLLGWAWTVRFQRTFAATDPEVIWGILTWFTFAVLLGVRLAGAPNGQRRAAFANVIGFAFVVASYLILRLFVAGEVFL